MVQYDGLSLSIRSYAHPSRTRTHTSAAHGGSVRRVTTRGCPLASSHPRARRECPHTPTRFTTNLTMHGLTMTSAVVGTKMTTRATSSSSRVSRGALTIVNSGAGPKRVRRATNERGRTGERPNARAEARGLPVVVATAIARERRSRERRRGTMGGWMRGNKNYFSRSSRRRRGCARGDVDGRCGRRIDRAIATAPRIRARGGEG